MNQYFEIVKRLTEQGKTVATMESCTGGAICNQITNVEGASEVLKFSAVTYSNEYKIKMGVREEIIAKFTVYSMETAKEMARCISKFADSDYGIGITGKMNRADRMNPCGEDNMIFVVIYDRAQNVETCFTVEATLASRGENKQLVVREIGEKLLSLLINQVSFAIGDIVLGRYFDIENSGGHYFSFGKICYNENGDE